MFQFLARVQQLGLSHAAAGIFAPQGGEDGDEQADAHHAAGNIRERHEAAVALQLSAALNEQPIFLADHAGDSRANGIEAFPDLAAEFQICREWIAFDDFIKVLAAHGFMNCQQGFERHQVGALNRVILSQGIKRFQQLRHAIGGGEERLEVFLVMGEGVSALADEHVGGAGKNLLQRRYDLVGVVDEVGFAGGVVIEFPPEDVDARDQGDGDAERQEERPSCIVSPRCCVFQSHGSLFR